MVAVIGRSVLSKSCSDNEGCYCWKAKRRLESERRSRRLEEEGDNHFGVLHQHRDSLSPAVSNVRTICKSKRNETTTHERIGLETSSSRCLCVSRPQWPTDGGIEGEGTGIRFIPSQTLQPLSIFEHSPSDPLHLPFLSPFLSPSSSLFIFPSSKRSCELARRERFGVRRISDIDLCLWTFRSLFPWNRDYRNTDFYTYKGRIAKMRDNVEARETRECGIRRYSRVRSC
ncbi:hypothetical protein C8R42DRAFT_442568 [Lentinula raphanica]|nr:hypothetical protein C8R42DRAFT_442568 [Lentinula raphanica]